MDAREHSIRAVQRPHPVAVVRASDFEIDEGRPVDAEEVLADFAYTLYCFDRERKSAIFVKSDSSAALEDAAFYYQAQAQNARSLAVLPIAVFHRLAERIPDPGDRVILIHSVSRCGSTLLSKAFAALPEVSSLSEPDDLTQLMQFRTAGLCEDDWVRQALVSSIRWRSRGVAGKLAIKTRSEVLMIADLLRGCFPQAKHLFLYRNAITWAGSILRGWPVHRPLYDRKDNRSMAEGWLRTHEIIGEYLDCDPPLNAIQLRILAWIACMEAYLDMRNSRLSLQALRYEDLMVRPRELLAEVFAFCDLHKVPWDLVDRVLGEDSQKGTIYDRSTRHGRELSPENIEEVKAVVSTRPRLRAPDVILPGTLLCD